MNKQQIYSPPWPTQRAHDPLVHLLSVLDVSWLKYLDETRHGAITPNDREPLRDARQPQQLTAAELKGQHSALKAKTVGRNPKTQSKYTAPSGLMVTRQLKKIEKKRKEKKEEEGRFASCGAVHRSLCFFEN